MSEINENANVNVNVNGEAAEDQMSVLTQMAKNFRKEMEKANKAGDIKGYQKAERELKAVNKQARQLAKNTFDVDKVMRNLSSAGPKELTRVIRDLNRRLNDGSVKRGSAEWKLYTNRLRLVKTEQRKVNNEIRGSSSLLTRLSTGFNKYFGIMTAGVASLTGLVFSFRKAVDTANEFESSVANLSALTGLAGKELDYLTKRALDFSGSITESGIRITKSAQDIVDAYTQMGSKRPELLKDKEALANVTEEAIILSQAAKMDLVPATNSLAISMNQFNAKAAEAKRYINVIAAGSKEGAGDVLYIASALEKAGTAADKAGLNIEEAVGVIETIAPKFSEPTRAGTQLKNVFIKLQTGADEFNPAIVGMEQALENLSDANLSAADMVKIFGVENLNAAQTLIDGKDEYKRYKDSITDTNVAIEQATKNTNTNKAKLEAARQELNKMTIQLGKKLAPALTFSTSAFSYFVKGIMGAIQFFNKYKVVIISITSGIVAYTIAVNAASIKTKIFTAATWLAEKATKAFNFAIKTNPLALIIGLLATAATALFLYKKKTKETTDQQKQFNEELERTAEQLGNISYQKFKGMKNFGDALKEASKKELESVKSYLEEEVSNLNRSLANSSKNTQIEVNGEWITIDGSKLNDGLNLLKNHLKQVDDELAKYSNIDKRKRNAKGQTFEEWAFEQLFFIEKQREFLKEHPIVEAEEEEAEDPNMNYLNQKYQESLEGRMAMTEYMYEQGIIGQTEYVDTMNDLYQEDAENHYKTTMEKMAIVERYFNGAMSLTNIWGMFNERTMNKALSKEQAKLDKMEEGTEAYEKQQKKMDDIRKESAEKQKTVAAIQAAIQGALGIVKTGAELGYPLAIPWQILQGTETLAQIALIESQQFARGRMPVRGASDGKLYFPQQTLSKPHTGVIQGPALVSELQDEAIINGPATRQLVFNYPNIWKGIQDLSNGFTPQFAEGRYPASTKEIRTEAFTDPALLAMLNKLLIKLDEPAKAVVVMNEDNTDNIQKGLNNKADFLKQVNGS